MNIPGRQSCFSGRCSKVAILVGKSTLGSESRYGEFCLKTVMNWADQKTFSISEHESKSYYFYLGGASHISGLWTTG